MALALLFALTFHSVSRLGFDGLIYRLGGSDQLYGEVAKVTDGDTITCLATGQPAPA